MPSSYVMLSGGPDSTALAYWAINEGREFDCLYLAYGHPAKQNELAVATAVSKKLNRRLVVLDMGDLYTSFVKGGADPDRSMRMAGCGDPYASVLIGATFAVDTGASSLLMGVHKDDVDAFPETLRVLNAQVAVIQAVSSLPGYATFKYEFPFLGMTKSEVLQVGQKLGASLPNTWSCYKVGASHCGVCPGCIKRKTAFSKSGLGDGTAYQN